LILFVFSVGSFDVVDGVKCRRESGDGGRVEWSVDIDRNVCFY
jgi:hypothetical protein